MRSTNWFYILIFLALGPLTACVSVNLGGNSTAKRAQDVKVQEPALPFQKQDRQDVDAAWKNSKNGNMLSYISDCQDGSDPSLDTILSGALNGLDDLKTEAATNPMIQGREGRRVLASGKVDGVASKIDLVAFKRNQCIYILSYVGVQKSFDQDHSAFDRFLQGFRAP